MKQERTNDCRPALLIEPLVIELKTILAKDLKMIKMDKEKESNSNKTTRQALESNQRNMGRKWKRLKGERKE